MNGFDVNEWMYMNEWCDIFGLFVLMNQLRKLTLIFSLKYNITYVHANDFIMMKYERLFIRNWCVMM